MKMDQPIIKTVEANHRISQCLDDFKILSRHQTIIINMVRVLLEVKKVKDKILKEYQWALQLYKTGLSTLDSG